ncbi:hypothetical protein [Nocardia sp. alder85J]|uniref:hypothetical protein n=1 Tax=Nocardia sp. alder85J TaxID=2862949 RepID=UPI001CD4CEC2|nr:hypothetical protein [Nocardia sp. alder85J]MCX4092090.1 hypothetical protein [Nocardia sp. alder85J]
MPDTDPPLLSGVQTLSPEDADLFEIAWQTHISTATSADGAITVQVSADGTIHRWELNESFRSAVPEQLIATVIELIGQARVAAGNAVHSEFGLRPPVEISTSRGTVASAPSSTPGPTPTIDSDHWDENEDYHHPGASRVADESAW